MNGYEVREQVRKKYAKAITAQKSCCTSSGCCGSTNGTENPITGGLYAANEVSGLPQEVVQASFGCGNPIALAELHPGEFVLDLGSGAGLDVLLSAGRVGPYGKAYGLDMTDEMLLAANTNKAKAGATNVEFLKGHIEAIPLPKDSVDVVISNCVINLSVDKDRVFQEIYRVLKPGGRVAVSDIVTTKSLPDKIKNNLQSWAGCISGALTDSKYKEKLSNAGFINIELEITRSYDLTDESGQNMIPELTSAERTKYNGSLVSAFIRAKKPARPLVEGKDYMLGPARADEFPQIHDLLSKSGLPTAGVNSKNGRYYVARNRKIMGVIGAEQYGTAVLLRSLTVDSQYQKRGIARHLLDYAWRTMQGTRVTDVYLLTNTAESYLAQYGFTKIERDVIPPVVLTTSALGDACPASSLCMYRRFQEDGTD